MAESGRELEAQAGGARGGERQCASNVSGSHLSKRTAATRSELRPRPRRGTRSPPSSSHAPHPRPRHPHRPRAGAEPPCRPRRMLDAALPPWPSPSASRPAGSGSSTRAPTSPPRCDARSAPGLGPRRGDARRLLLPPDLQAGDLRGAANVNVVWCTRLAQCRAARRVTARPPVSRERPALRRRAPARDAQRGEPRLAGALGDRSQPAHDRRRAREPRHRAHAARRRARARRVEERNRLAARSHDTLAQSLAAIATPARVGAAPAERGDARPSRETIERALELTRAALDDARRSVLELRAPPLGRGGSLDALAVDAIARARWRADSRSEVEGAARERTRCPPRSSPDSSHRARGARQRRRATPAQQRCPSLSRAPRATSRSASSDDGVGFDVAALPPGRFGLVGMSERARLLGGQLRVVTAPDAGTTIAVAVPIHASALEEERVSSRGSADPRRVADDHPVVRDGLVAMLATEPSSRSSARRPPAPRRCASSRRGRPTSCSSISSCPGSTGSASSAACARSRRRQARSCSPCSTPTSGSSPPSRPARRGYLLKGAPRAELFAAIRSVHGGGSLLAAGVVVGGAAARAARRGSGRPRVAHPARARRARAPGPRARQQADRRRSSACRSARSSST